MDPSNFQPVSQLNPQELPDGFTMHDPHQSSSDVGGGNAEQQQQKAQVEAMLEQMLTGPALARLRRVRMVRPQQAAIVEKTLIGMAPRLTERVSEGKLIELLERGNAVTKKKTAATSSISIQRKKYAIDSDDDDNDDDLL